MFVKYWNAGGRVKPAGTTSSDSLQQLPDCEDCCEENFTEFLRHGLPRWTLHTYTLIKNIGHLYYTYYTNNIIYYIDNYK